MKNKCFQRKAKRFLASILALAMILTVIPPVTAFAEIGTTKYSYKGYDVEYTVTGEWSAGQNVEVKVTNTGDESILNWAFRYDAGSKIVNIWNATIVENQGTEYVVKNSGWNYEILPQQSISFGYTLAEGGIPVSKEFELYSKRVEVTSGYEVKLNTINAWGNGAQAEIVISNTSDNPLEAWEFSFDCNFKIEGFWGAKKVETTDKDYGFASEVWSNPIPAGGSISIGFTATIDGEMEISNCNLSEVIIEDMEINWEDETDTDGDDLPDVYEVHAYDTDPNKADTDGDNLPDGYEVLELYTNPTMSDTDSNGTSDAFEDFDADGLTNYEEYEIGTEPCGVDTDEDYLNDGDEVKVYGTNPLNPDTDDDGILDGDEVILGLNPKNSEDGKTPIKQTLTEEKLEINEYNSEFKISLEVEASNNVERFLEQDVSGYSGLLSENRAIVGMPVRIDYVAGEVVSGSIVFRLDADFVENDAHYYPELGLGIERYGVFCYDDSVGTIVPLPCTYDVENNCITVDAKYMGDLFVLDYESLMYDLGVEPEVSTYAMTRVLAEENEEMVSSNEVVTDFEDVSLEEIESIILGSSQESNRVEMYTLRTSDVAAVVTTSDEAMRQVDLVLAVDTTGSMGFQIATVKRNLSSLINRLREDGISLYVSVVDYRDITCDGINSTKVNNNSGEDFYNAVSDISSVISSLTPWGGGDGPETAIDALGAAYNLNYRNAASKYIFLITDANYKNNNNYGIATMTEIAAMLKTKGISASVVTYTNYYSVYKGLTEATGGELISMSTDFCDAMYEAIYAKTPESSVVIANNLVTGSFKQPLVYGGTCDTDGDGLTDSEEVDWKKVKKIYDGGTYSLYTWKELCKKGGIFSSVYDEGENNPLFELFADVLVIPATSNPFSADTDKDYYPDDVDDEVLVKNPMWIDDVGIDDSGFHSGVIVYAKSSGKYTDGKLSVNNTTQRAVYTFDRKVNEYAYFTLVPQENSFYKFTDNAPDLRIKVTYEKGFLFKKTETVQPQEDGTYLLYAGKEYTIKAYGLYYSGNYELEVEQDNWVYAPEGAIWSVSERSTGNKIVLALGERVVSEKLYMSSDSIFDAIECLYDDSIILERVEGGNIEEQIHSVLVNSGMQVSEEEYKGALENIYSTVGTTIVLVIEGIILPEGKAKIVAFIISAANDTVSFFGVPKAVETIMRYFEKCGFSRACIEGKMNVYATRYHTLGMGNVWEGWNTFPYVNKMSNTGDIGKVNPNITSEEIIRWCDWERQE